MKSGVSLPSWRVMSGCVLLFVVAVLLLPKSAEACFSSSRLTAETLPATNVTETSADLNGGVTVVGLPYRQTQYYFEYGTDTSYGSQTDSEYLGGATELTASIAGLSAGTTYHYRVVVFEMIGSVVCATAYGEDQEFTTPVPEDPVDETPDDPVDETPTDETPPDDGGGTVDTSDTPSETPATDSGSTSGEVTASTESGTDSGSSSNSDSVIATSQGEVVAATSATAVPSVTTTSARRCSGLRLFKIRIRNLKGGVTIISAKVRVDGRVAKVRRQGKRLTAMIDLRDRIRETVKIKITARTSTGRTVRGVRIYHPCRPYLSNTPPKPL